MEFYLQVGFGMMGVCKSLTERWGGGTTILSPRDLTDVQLRSLSHDLQERGGSVLVDPQFYIPAADHERLTAHEYWPGKYDAAVFYQGAAMADMIGDLFRLNVDLGTTVFILPGLLTDAADTDWGMRHGAFLEEALRLDVQVPLWATLALTPEFLRSTNQVHELLEETESALREGCSGYYLICQHPNSDYLVTDPLWLANLLDLVAGLRLQGRSVVLGYAQHEMLMCAASAVSGIASGTWMNVRSFSPSRFQVAEDEIAQRRTWYYVPAALSEFRLEFLDLADQQDVLDLMAPPTPDLEAANALFAGNQPTTVGLSETDAFQHYLHCLRAQAGPASAPTFADTVSRLRTQLTAAGALLNRLASSGVRAGQRDFSECLDPCLGALDAHSNNRGAVLTREWTSL